MVQVLSPICETFFSDYSYGFRPKRSCEQAINKLLEYFNDGYEWIVAVSYTHLDVYKRQGYIYVDLDDRGHGSGKRLRKDSFGLPKPNRKYLLLCTFSLERR